MTRKDYDTEHLIRLLQGLKARYPHLRIILEPGSAFTWQTGVLTSKWWILWKVVVSRRLF